jgi:small-conductance mechanosensitive channel/CRP-like cAMP-binding protein
MILASLAVVLLFALRVWGLGEITAHLPAPYQEPVIATLGVALAVAAAFLLDRILRAVYWNGYLKRKRKQDTPALIKDIMTVALFAIGVSLGLFFEAGVSFAALLAASGATAIVLGIALQTVIQDLFSGLSINFDRSYAIGDWLTIYSDQFPGPVYGCVAGITWRTTFLRLDDGCSLMVPNRLVISNPVLNHSRPRAPKRLSVRLVIDNRFPSERIVSILLAEAFRTVRRNGLVPRPEPDVLVAQIGADAITYEVRFYSDPDAIVPAQAMSLMSAALHDAMLRHKLPMPVAQIELTRPPGEFAFGDKDVEEALSRLAIFTNVLDQEHVAALAAASKLRAWPADAVMIRQGEQASSMFVILEGAARVTSAAANGESQEVTVLAGGDIVGEMSLMTGAPRNATVVSVTPLRCLEITKEAFDPLVRDSPELLERLSHVLAERQLALKKLAEDALHKDAVQADMLARMRHYFSRMFHVRGVNFQEAPQERGT